MDKRLFGDDDTFYRKAQKLLLNLSQACDKIPSSLFIKGVKLTRKNIVFSGGFADIYLASYNGQDVALKCVRIFQNNQDHYRIQRVHNLHCINRSMLVTSLARTGSASRGSRVAEPQASVCSAISRNGFGDLPLKLPVHCAALDAKRHNGGIHKKEGALKGQHRETCGYPNMFFSVTLRRPCLSFRCFKLPKVSRIFIGKMLSMATCTE